MPCDGVPPPPVTPTPPTNPPVADLCLVANAKAKQLDSLYLNGKFDSTLNTLGDFGSLPNEKMFVVYKKYSVNPYNVHDTIITGYRTSTIYISNGANSGTASIPQPGFHELYASVAHTHRNSGYKAQSAYDVYYMINWTLTETRYEGNFAVPSGDRYAVAVTNMAQAGAFYGTIPLYLDGDSWKEGSAIKKSFDLATEYFEKIYKSNPDVKHLAYEMAMATVLSEFNSGVTLFKRNSAGHFVPIIVQTILPNPAKPNKKTYQIINCDIQ